MPNDAVKSFDEIAATMIGPAQPPADPPDERQNGEGQQASVSEDDQGSPQPGGEDPGEDEGNAPDGALEDGSEGEEALGDDADDQQHADDGGDDDQPYELTDDTVFAVTVDGEQQEVTLADLKKAYAGEGAIAKRLQEATEARKAVDAEKAQVEQQLSQGREKLIKAFQTFDAMMFAPSVKPPDPQLAQTDPQKYLLQKEQYRDEQTQLQQRRQQVYAAMQKYEQQEQQKLLETKQQHAAKLVEALPELRDPQKGKEVSEAIVNTAKAYGFTEQEIGQAYDWRVFKMVSDLARLNTAQKGQTVQDTTAQPMKTRVLRPGSQNKRRGTAVSRQQQEAVRRARKTGSVDDVAQTMIVSKPRRN